MNLLEKLQKLSSASTALRGAHLKKEAGFATALLGTGKSIANKAVHAVGGHIEKQIAKHGPVGAAVGLGVGGYLAAKAPGTAANTYKANKVGFNPEVHKANLGL